MSSETLVLPNMHERNSNVLLFLVLAAVQQSQWWPQWWQEWVQELEEMGAQRAAGGCLMSHHILPSGEHLALQVGALFWFERGVC